MFEVKKKNISSRGTVAQNYTEPEVQEAAVPEPEKKKPKKVEEPVTVLNVPKTEIFESVAAAAVAEKTEILLNEAEAEVSKN